MEESIAVTLDGCLTGLAVPTLMIDLVYPGCEELIETFQAQGRL